MSAEPLLTRNENGLYCPAGDFYVDPWRGVDRALITHAHSDHARFGSRHYLSSKAGEPVLRARLGEATSIESVDYGERVTLNGVHVSLHPAGHLLGSAQVRIEHLGQVCVVSGDYKLQPDPTCAPFEPLRCHTFVTESTFGLPIYRWPAQEQVVDDVQQWWRRNQQAGKASLLLAYSLGKAQRLLALLDPQIGPIYAHGAVEKMNQVYRAAGIPLPQTPLIVGSAKGIDWSRALIVAPPSANGTPWSRKFGPTSTGFASGWMRVRGARRWRSIDRGFVLSDHVDWPGLLIAIRETGAEQVWVTHGQTAVVARWLSEQGIEARAISTRFEGESEDAADVVEDSPSKEAGAAEGGTA